MAEIQYYGTPIPHTDPKPYPGKLIVIEGTDGVGRSTHIAELRAWLEAQGHAVADTGMARSDLAGKGLQEAKMGHTLGRHTLQLFYAADFADRLENEILPALRAGFIVLTDRYIYSALARAIVRDIDADWVRSLYSFAIVPDVIFYLRIKSAEELVMRLISSGRGFDYWESGMDLSLGEDFYESFVRYQTKLLNEFDGMTLDYNFRVVNASRTVSRVSTELRRAVASIVEPLIPALEPQDTPEVIARLRRDPKAKPRKRKVA